MESLKSSTSATLRGNSSRPKTVSFLAAPSSRTSKSSFFRPAMICPVLFFTVVSIITRFTSTRIASCPWSCAVLGIGKRQPSTPKTNTNVATNMDGSGKTAGFRKRRMPACHVSGRDMALRRFASGVGAGNIGNNSSFPRHLRCVQPEMPRGDHHHPDRG